MKFLTKMVMLFLLVLLCSSAYAADTGTSTEDEGQSNAYGQMHDRPLSEPAVEEESPFAADANIGYCSHYMWRGQTLSNKGVIEPSVTFSYYGLAVNYWSNYDSDKNKTTETDYTVSYTHGFDKLSLGVGQIYYQLDGIEDTQEVFLTAGYDVLLKPSFTWYYDFREGRGSYFELKLGHSFALPYDIALNLGATASYVVDNVIMGTEQDGSDLDCFYHSNLSVSATIPVYKAIYATPMMAVSFPLDDDARRIFRNIIRANSYDGGGATVVYGGLTVGFAM
ncbi:MAG: hypothetical protein L3V56_12960 [Candidatus Magnetoovum sp. WYHC-5]|nr:hypothetical protein [Candidatus Magnetoovum sp. WYHC-5]